MKGILDAVLKAGLPIIDKWIPDTNARKAAEEALRAAAQQADIDARQGQLEVNRVEAAHRSIFVAGWRPAVGWVCVAAFGFTYVVRPLLLYAAALHGGIDLSAMPEIDISGMTPILLGMLGLGTLRTFEKAKGVAK